jgi:hypothetical protein
MERILSDEVILLFLGNTTKSKSEQAFLLSYSLGNYGIPIPCTVFTEKAYLVLSEEAYLVLGEEAYLVLGEEAHLVPYSLMRRTLYRTR